MGDVEEAEAEAAVLQDTAITMTAHKAVVVVLPVEEAAAVVTPNTATLTEAGGPEVGVRAGDRDVAEVREERETEVQLEKEALKEELKSNNGIEKKSKRKQSPKLQLVKMIIMMVVYIMEIERSELTMIMIMVNRSRNKMMAVMTTDEKQNYLEYRVQVDWSKSNPYFLPFSSSLPF